MAGFEHALFLVLLLGFLLRELKTRHPAYLLLVIIGMGLILLPPHVEINIPWELFLGVVLPWILWRHAQNWLQVTWRIPWKEICLWIVAAAILAFIFALVGSLSWSQAIFFGIIATSLFWKMSSGERSLSPLVILGPLTLVLLLAETSLKLDDPKEYLGGLLSGAGIGIAVAILSILASRKAPSRDHWVSLGLTYAAYWIAMALKSSPIAAVLIGIGVFSEFHRVRRKTVEDRGGTGRTAAIIPLLLLLAMFVFLSWQAHQPMAFPQWYEIILSMITGIVLAMLGVRMGLARFEDWGLNARNALILGLYLFGILILWPRGAQLEQVITWVAIGLAVLLLAISRVLLAALRDIGRTREEQVDEKYPHF
jgi:hypothetical protein